MIAFSDLTSLRNFSRILCLIACVGNAQPVVAQIQGVVCSVPAPQAAVQIFEYIEAPNFQFDSAEEYRAIFSRRLLSSSSNTSVNAAIRSARSTYQGDRNETPLSRRLAAPPVLLTRDSSQSGATVRISSLSTRGRIEQRMSLICESGVWKADSFSYGPSDK
jgi:hypothetical protein